MSQIVNVNNLPQIGRPNTAALSQAPTSIRFSQVVTVTPISFVFPQGAGTNFKFGIPQSMFVDNSFNDFEMIISVQGTAYSFPVPALSSGYYNVDAIDGDTIMATSAGVSSDVVEIVFYNYQKAPIVWYKNQTTSTAVTIADGADATQGSVADAAVTNPASNATVVALLKGILTEIISSGVGTAVTIADGADVTQGTKADAAVTDPTSSGTLMAFIKGILTQLQAAIPAGANIIGKLGIDQTTPGTTNGVVINAALPFGTNLLGETGIDQTTPGVTNGVQVNAALPAGINLLGKVGIDQTTTGSTNAVADLRPGTQVVGDSGNVANANAVATIAGAAGKTNFLTGFTLSAAGSTAGAAVTATITGLIGGTKSYTFVFPIGALVSSQPIAVQFEKPLQATGTNVAIVVTLPAGGAGNTNASATAEGFQL